MLVLPGQIDCLIANLSADAETRNPRPNIVWPVGLEGGTCNKNSAGAWKMLYLLHCTALHRTAPGLLSAVSAHPLAQQVCLLCSALGSCLPRRTHPPPRSGASSCLAGRLVAYGPWNNTV